MTITKRVWNNNTTNIPASATSCRLAFYAPSQSFSLVTQHCFESTREKCMAAHKITTVVPHVLQNIKPSIKHRRYIPASWTGQFWLPSLHVFSLSLSLSLSLSVFPSQNFLSSQFHRRDFTYCSHMSKPWLSPQHIQTHTHTHRGKSAVLSLPLCLTHTHTHTHTGKSFTSRGSL